MASTWVSTRQAVVAMLGSLVTANALEAVFDGRQERFDVVDLPCAEVWTGAGQLSRDQDANVFERRHTRAGTIRLSVRRVTDLPIETNDLDPLKDAVEAVCGANPHLGGEADRFDIVQNTEQGMEQVGEIKTVYVDYQWIAIDAESGAIVKDW